MPPNLEISYGYAPYASSREIDQIYHPYESYFYIFKNMAQVNKPSIMMK